MESWKSGKAPARSHTFNRQWCRGKIEDDSIGNTRSLHLGASYDKENIFDFPDGFQLHKENSLKQQIKPVLTHLHRAMQNLYRLLLLKSNASSIQLNRQRIFIN